MTGRGEPYFEGQLDEFKWSGKVSVGNDACDCGTVVATMITTTTTINCKRETPDTHAEANNNNNNNNNNTTTT